MKEHKNPAANSNSDLKVRVVSSPKQRQWFDQQLDLSHDLGSSPSIGDFLRQIVELHGKRVALLAWGPACYALKDRDLWISWSAPQRIERLKLIVQNRRLLILPSKGSSPNLASMAMGAALRALPSQWFDSFGYRPVLAESFTDPEAHHGTTYKATNWTELGTTAGYSRSRLDFYFPNERPKRLWCLELVPKARSILRSRDLPVEYAPALSSVPTRVLPLSQAQFDSLRKAVAQVPDPRKGSNKRFRIGLLLSLIAMALLSGRREIAEIARFAQSLTQEQRKKVGLPLKKGTQAFRIVPGYLVFYRLLCRIDPKALNEVLNNWLASNASTLPQALAMDGKMFRDHFGVLSLARHSDGAPVAMALYDQKEGTDRCEQSAANALIESMPFLDNQLITADALHCQRKVARTIVEKGASTCCKLRETNPTLRSGPRRRIAPRAPPFCPDRNRPRSGRNPGTGHLCDRRNGHGLPLCPERRGGSQSETHQEERGDEPGNALLFEQSGPRREESGSMAPIDSRSLGRSRDPQPLAP